MRKIAEDLSIAWPRSPETCQGEVAEFLAADLRHHRVPDRAVVESPAVPALIRRAYVTAMSAATDSRGSAEEATWDLLRAQLGEADSLLGPVLATLHDRQTVLGRDLLAAQDELQRVEADKETLRQRIAANEVERATLRQRIAVNEVERATLGVQI